VGDVVEYLGDEGLRLASELELDGYLRHNYSSLSSGNRRKLVLLTCLAKEADLYIIDEPFASLDYRSKLIVGQIINREGTNKTVLVSTHEVANLHPKDVVFMVDGVVVKVIRGYRPVFEAVIESSNGERVVLNSMEDLNRYMRDGYKIIEVRQLGLFDQLYGD